MADPATAAGLALGVIPLIISALENYEYTFQPIIIFSRRYRKEVEKFQKALKVQKVNFANECTFLLHSVTSDRGNLMIDDLEHPLWRDDDLESRLRNRLSDSYDGCVSSLSLINDILVEILQDTKSLDILLQKKHGRLDIEWLKRLRQRSKISFSKDRYDGKLRELENRIQGLHRIRKHVMHIQYAAGQVYKSLPASAMICMRDYCAERRALCRLHEGLSSLWQCEELEEHTANISLDINDDESWQETRILHFDVAWWCPAQEQESKPLRLLVETLSLGSHSVESASPHTLDLQHSLETALDLSAGQRRLFSDASPAGEKRIASSLPDLHEIPNLCRYLRQSLPGATIRRAGFLQSSQMFKHVIYAPSDDVGQTTNVINSLEEVLKAAKANSNGIPLPEKLELAKLLALAVLRFYSTPWLSRELRSENVVFLDVRDFSQKPVRRPFLKSRVFINSDGANQLVSGHTTVGSHGSSSQLRSPVRNQTLYSFGVMLVELAYNSPLQDLQISEDDQGDPHTLYWAALRLGERVWRELGQKYADAVKICLYGGFGASSELDDDRVQRCFFDEVVWKLERCAEAVAV